MRFSFEYLSLQVYKYFVDASKVSHMVNLLRIYRGEWPDFWRIFFLAGNFKPEMYRIIEYIPFPPDPPNQPS